MNNQETRTRLRQDVIKVMELSDKVQSIVDDKDDMSNGDYHGCIGAVIMQAIQYGRTSK